MHEDMISCSKEEKVLPMHLIALQKEKTQHTILRQRICFISDYMNHFLARANKTTHLSGKQQNPETYVAEV